MDQPPQPTSGDPSARGVGLPSRPQHFGSKSDSDPSTFETAPASSAPSGNSSSSAILAALTRRYEILGEAGHGAMGQVYKARDRETGEIVALKLLKSEIASDPAMLERFKSELLFARKITHKNVCRVHEFNRIDGIAYTSMEFVEGESLRSVLNRFGGLAPRKAIDIALQMCSGLKEAHAQGIVHRDLKPENVMIDTQGNVKIMDFGIARSMEALTLSTGSMVGTPAYMSPEQVTGKAVDYRADIYALGLILYEMFTGAQPFRGDNAVAVALMHMQETPRSPRALEPSISDVLERTILKCLEKLPENRFQSIAELDAALRAQIPATPNATDATAIARSDRGSSSRDGSADVAAAPKPRRTFTVVAIVAIALLAICAEAIWRSMSPRTGAEKITAENSPSARAPVAAVAPTQALSAPPVEAAKPVASPLSKVKKMTVTSSLVPTFSSVPAAKSKQESSSPASLPANEAPTSGADPRAAVAAPVAAQTDDASPAMAAQAGDAVRRGGYVFVNRYPREIGAQNAAKKIEDMGLPVTVIPRHNGATNNDFYVVLSGPYPAPKISEIIAQLKTSGFPLARSNRAPTGSKSPSRGASPVPMP